MKKFARVIIIAVLVAALCVVPAFAEEVQPAEPQEAGAGNMILDAAIQGGIELAGTLINTAVALICAWAAAKLGKTGHTVALKKAVEQCGEVVTATVSALQAKYAGIWKEYNADHKLTAEEVQKLNHMLVEDTLAALPNPTIKLLEAGKADLNKLILNLGEEALIKIKATEENKQAAA